MKIQDWVKSVGIRINLQYPDLSIRKDNQWTARLHNSYGTLDVVNKEKKHYSPLDLSKSQGTGETPEIALNDLCKTIRGKVAVLNLSEEQRRFEYNIPKDLTV